MQVEKLKNIAEPPAGTQLPQGKESCNGTGHLGSAYDVIGATVIKANISHLLSTVVGQNQICF